LQLALAVATRHLNLLCEFSCFEGHNWLLATACCASVSSVELALSVNAFHDAQWDLTEIFGDLTQLQCPNLPAIGSAWSILMRDSQGRDSFTEDTLFSAWD